MKMMGDVDHDFAAMMISHHRGAIEMARVEVAYGHHADLRQMAVGMILAQSAEIVELRTWLAAEAED